MAGHIFVAGMSAKPGKFREYPAAGKSTHMQAEMALSVLFRALPMPDQREFAVKITRMRWRIAGADINPILQPQLRQCFEDLYLL